MTNTHPSVESYLKDNPFIAILRGIKPEEVLDVATVITKAGWRCLEVPMNSPDPMESISRLTAHYGTQILIGGGTVMRVGEVDQVALVGGRLIVTPACVVPVIKEAVKREMAVMPGFVTPTEAFTAYDAGARYLKLFPADTFGPTYIKAVSTVLPKDSFIVPVGGVTPENIGAFRAAGCTAFGIGSAVYKAGMSATEVGQRAANFTAAWISLKLKSPS